MSYGSAAARPLNYSQNLWKVEDLEYYKSGERFVQDYSPLLDIIANQEAGPLESAPIPKGLVLFVTDYLNLFQAVPSRHTKLEHVLYKVFSFLDIHEFYFLLFGSLIQHNANPLLYTYRLKTNGTTLRPDKLECFHVVPQWKFEPFTEAERFVRHPDIESVLRGAVIPHHTKRTPITETDILEKLSEIVYGHHEVLVSEVEEWLFAFYEDIRYSTKTQDEEVYSLDADQVLDSRYWFIATLAALIWFKSPHALRFLSEYHPIYRELLVWDKGIDRVMIDPKSGGEAIVDGWTIYTRADLVVEENAPPGTCGCCKQALHCTKFVNSEALFHPICSCGKPVYVEDTDGTHHFNRECVPYQQQHPPFNSFVCQRCLAMALHRLPPTTQCQRSSCPALECKHHPGASAFGSEMTNRRRMLLTQQPQQ